MLEVKAKSSCMADVDSFRSRSEVLKVLSFKQVEEQSKQVERQYTSCLEPTANALFGACNELILSGFSTILK